jgi:hypothetical protein
MAAIQSLMLWSGGWHINSDEWRLLSEYRAAELVSEIKRITSKEQ